MIQFILDHFEAIGAALGTGFVFGIIRGIEKTRMKKKEQDRRNGKYFQ